MPLPRLVGCVIEFFHNPRSIEHALKVFAYAQGIGGEEGLDGNDALILAAAALLHDVGIPSSLERFGSAEGKYQEKEGERLCPELLRRAGAPEGIHERVAGLVGRHHSEELASGDPLLQMLMEADYLVNLVEGNLPGRDPREVYEGFFRTDAGKRYMRALFAI